VKKEMSISIKQQYRSELGIISEILQVTMDCGMEGAIISAISRRANLSHYTSMEKCQKLLDFGLLESTTNNKSRTFVITEKGIQFFHEIQKFLEIAQEIKIRC
jgi:predicted transcriptional regulator